MNLEPRFSQYNEHSILVEWEAVIDNNLLQDMLVFKIKIENLNSKQIVEVINAYNSILIIYKNTIDNINDVFLDLKKLYKLANNKQQIHSRTFKIPVCYDDEFGTDLDDFSKAKGYSKSDIIMRHTEVIYTVYFIGFLPGFLYLGGLSSDLYFDRKTSPNLNVKKGAVAIGGKQTGIYPQDSPGGWHIIGNSPIELFNLKRSIPCFIKAGDKVMFQQISKYEYIKIKNEIENFTFDSKTLLIDD